MERGILLHKSDSEAESSSRRPDVDLPWQKDPTVRLAIVNQVLCTFVILAGAEITPIWMATSRASGG